MRKRFTDWLGSPRLPVWLAVIAVILAIPSLWAGLQVDDYIHRLEFQGFPTALRFFDRGSMFVFMDGDPVRAQGLMDFGLVPWWTFKDVLLKFYRPIAVATHRLDYALWPDVPWAMHLNSLFWFACLIVLVALLYRRIMAPGWVAGLAGLLYAVDDARAMPAGWIANRNAIMAGLFGVMAILLHDQWRRGKRPWALGLALGALLLALLSNESGLAVTAYLFAYAVFLDKDTWPRRMATLVPYAVLVIAWRVTYTLMGCGAFGSATYIDPLRSPISFARAALERFPILLSGQWAAPSSDLYFFSPLAAKVGLWAWAAVVVVAFGVLALPLLKRDAVARFWFTGTLLALVPVCATFPSDRLLTLAGIGGMGFLAQCIAALSARTRDAATRPRTRGAAKVLFVALVAIHLVIAPISLPGRILAFTAVNGHMYRSMNNAPVGDSMEGKTIVVANAPNMFFGFYFPIVHAVAGKPIAPHYRSLGPNMGFPVAVRVTREDENTLVYEPDGGFTWFLMRDIAHGFNTGDVVEVEGMTTTVRRVSKRGEPLEVAYRFDVPLEDESLVWIGYDRRWNAMAFTPPAIGETVVLNTRDASRD